MGAGQSDGSGPAAEPVLEVRGLDKRFGGVHALRGATLTLTRPGVVHCLVGENGSGKSTLLGVLSGQQHPDAGEVRLEGQPVFFFGHPPAAVRAGIAMVSQETAIARDLSVAENILLGKRLIRRRGRIDWPATRRRAQEMLDWLNLDYDVSMRVGRLRPDQQQMVEIARAVSIDAKVLILDEPTSFLTEDQVERLFQAVRDLSSRGVATIFVSHRLPELFAIADEVTVLRDGSTVSSGPIAEYDSGRIVHDMVGEPESEIVRTNRSGSGQAGVPRLRVQELSDGAAIRAASLDVAPAEIVGVAGLAGSGRSELLELIFGARPLDGGSVFVDGERILRLNPARAIGAGIGFVPAERKADGVVLTMSVLDNLTMAHAGGSAWWRPPHRRRQAEELARTMSSLRVKAASPAALVGTLSGGNQQKVALGKWLVNNPRLLLLEEPTRGVDVRAKAEIHALLKELADQGMGLLVSSSENEELLGLCDRILVMYRGEIVAALSAAEATEIELAQLSGGSSK